MTIITELYKMIIAGGVVMIPLCIFSIIAATLIIERLAFWIKIITDQPRLAQEVIKIYRSNLQVGDLEARLISFLQKNRDLPIGRIFLSAFELNEATPEEFKLALETAAQVELPKFKKFNTMFETIITISPLLGLLGTILGLMQSFSSLKIGDIGSSNTLNVSAGISESLISTSAGLIVAIFALFFHHIFKGFYREQIGIIQEYGGQLELIYMRRYSAKNPKYENNAGISLNGGMNRGDN
ncbi:MAG TPA: MotA/TolQ/ExbB proton channel family protein [Allocoleopsis sp.]